MRLVEVQHRIDLTCAMKGIVQTPRGTCFHNILMPFVKEELATTFLGSIQKLYRQRYDRLRKRDDLDVFRDNHLNRWKCNTISPRNFRKRAEFIGLPFRKDQSRWRSCPCSRGRNDSKTPR